MLLYHRIARVEHDPFALCVTPENFAAHIAVMARFARPTRLADLAPSAPGTGPRSVVVTFDDGYSEILTLALPILQRFGVPATVFAVSGALGRVFWWDRMIHIPPAVARAHLEATGERSAGRENRAAAGVHRRLHRLLSGMAEEERDALIGRLSEDQADGLPPPRSLTGEELRRLHASGLFEIGGHTHSHPDLSRLDAAAQVEEIERSRSVLTRLLDAPVTSFAYPFGTFAHFDGAIVDRVRQAGYERACTAEPGVVTGREAPFRLPRLWVQDWSEDELERRLKAWLR